MSWKLNTENDGTRFAPVACTPKELVVMLDYGDRGITSLGIYGEKFKLTPRFHKSLASELGVPYGIFELFQPEEVMHRAAEVRPDLKLRVTLDCKRGEALGVTERRGVPLPVRYVTNPPHAYTGTMLAKGFDLEDLYPNAQRTSRFYMRDLALGRAA